MRIIQQFEFNMLEPLRLVGQSGQDWQSKQEAQQRAADDRREQEELQTEIETTTTTNQKAK